MPSDDRGDEVNRTGYRPVELPDTWGEWDADAKINYLCGAMDREQIANVLRDRAGLEAREKPLLRKDEIAQILVAIEEDGFDVE